MPEFANLGQAILLAEQRLQLMVFSIGDFTENKDVKAIAGFVGIFCGLSAIYSAMAQIVNREFGRKIFPT